MVQRQAASLIRSLADLSYNPAFEQAVPSLISALNNPAGSSRTEALLALGQIAVRHGSTNAAVALVRSLSDPMLRELAAEQVSRFGPELRLAIDATQGRHLVQPLMAHLQNPETWNPHLLIHALGKVGPAAKEAVPLLKHRLTDKSCWVRLNSAVALLEIGSDEPTRELAFRTLMGLLGHGFEIRIRRSAARAIGDLGRAVAGGQPFLTETLNTEDEELRSLAKDALTKIRLGY